jgi:glucose/arabinose dehydrogenase
MTLLPDGRMLLAEISGRVRMIGPGGAASAPIAGFPDIAQPVAQIGLQDIVLDRAFAKNRILYFSYGTLKPGQPPRAASFGAPPEAVGHIAKARLSATGDRLEDTVELYQGPQIRRLVAARDGTLFVSTTSGGPKSQAIDDDNGKVLRIKTDGSAPPDNPFANRADLGRFVYALGFRDPDGMTLDAQGRVWTIEHGPRGGDELNLVRPGKNYGFPVIGYGRTYANDEINGGLTVKEGLEQPVYFWTPDVAPSGLMIYSGKMFPQWRGDIFLGGLVAGSVIRLTTRDDKVVSEEFMLAERCARIRDVREAPDGSIYVLTDAAAAGEVLRLVKN